MTYDPQKHHRRSLRLTGYDYTQAGAYFVTVCAQDRACLFGEVAGDQMCLNDAGRMVLAEWISLPDRFPAVELDEVIVMPNHIHGILVVGTTTKRATTRVAPTPKEPVAGVGPNETAISGPVGATLVVAPPVSDAAAIPTAQRLGDVVGAFKSLTTGLYIQGVKQSGWPPFRGRLWQRNYHEHIIRNERSLNHVRQYILDNPANWASDQENPEADRPEERTA